MIYKLHLNNVITFISGRISDEIMKEHNVSSGIELLSKNEVRSIVVVGKYGNSVTSISRRISKTFKNMVNWNSLECRYTVIPNTVAKNTIIFVHGWFGMWNDDLCSLEKAKTACQSLIRILKEKNDVKLILGIRSDVYNKYRSELDKEVDNQNMSLVYYEIHLDDNDFRKNTEYSKYLNNQIKKNVKRATARANV